MRAFQVQGIGEDKHDRRVGAPLVRRRGDGDLQGASLFADDAVAPRARLSTDGEERRVAELYALYVRPAWWSTGTGRALMDRVLARSARAGYSSITLWVLRDNRRARRFYERAGFAPDGATNVLTRLGDVLELRYRRSLQL